MRRAREDGVEVAADDRELFARSDVLSLHLALTPQTRGIVRREHLALMKPDALIVNTSRAGLIEPAALAEALRAGRPGLAALDVFDVEPAPIDDPLPRMPNVVATPHHCEPFRHSGQSAGAPQMPLPSHAGLSGMRDGVPALRN